MTHPGENNLIFATPHGSVLYGLDHAGSDRDVMYVYADNRKARQRLDGDLDYVTVGLGHFLDLAHGGAHQYLEALFSPIKEWCDDGYKPMIDNMIVPPALVRNKYMRTIKHFSYGDTLKRRRHALRLAWNLADLTEYGRFNPRLSWGVAGTLTNIASARTGDEIYEAAKELASCRRIR